MSKLSKKVSEIIDKSSLDFNSDQIRKFDDLLKNMHELQSKSVNSNYSFPQIDTLGRRTYSSLNRI